tara:strand:- start:246 stop:389 length:144 start_codon:yes stop_codon:yes gene_type:complete
MPNGTAADTLVALPVEVRTMALVCEFGFKSVGIKDGSFGVYKLNSFS